MTWFINPIYTASNVTADRYKCSRGSACKLPKEGASIMMGLTTPIYTASAVVPENAPTGVDLAKILL